MFQVNNINTALTHFQSMFHFYTHPGDRKKPDIFLMFSRGTEVEQFLKTDFHM